VTIVTTFHGFPFSDAPKLYRKLVYGRSRKIICVSRYEKSVYEKKWKLPALNKLCVVYNGIDFTKLNNPDSDSSSALVTDKNALNMMMVGSFRSGRSHLFVCRVADELNKKGIPFNLYFVGKKVPSEPQRYDSCVKFCAGHGLSERVHFLGERNDVPSLLRQMDLFIYSSEHDTFGIAVLEAMASGLPVIVNDWEVMKEVSGNGKYATLYETDNVEDCLSKILAFNQKMATSPEILKEDNLHISKEIQNQYSIENHIRGLYEIYKSCF
jgi:glycosyltransferase involved in cell wall biosynthesis